MLSGNGAPAAADTLQLTCEDFPLKQKSPSKSGPLQAKFERWASRCPPT